METEETIIKVPVKLDALFVESNDHQSTLSMADFSQLPYYLSDGSTINTQKTPNLAEAAFHPRLGGEDGLSLPKGVHLHWALPDALTTGHSRDGNMQFPAAPNRWLVRRLNSDGKLERSWIVESDYLHPLDRKNANPVYKDPADGSSWPGHKPITFPTKRPPLSKGKPGAAFRYMGRTLLLSDWLSENSGGKAYLNQDANSDFNLTALGYGEPTFGAYYPNCYSVFGFCDADGKLKSDDSYEYQVIGWFNEADLDPLRAQEFAKFANDTERFDALEKEYNWHLSDADKKEGFPDRSIYFASLTLTPEQVSPWSSKGNVDIAIANTGGEALSALVADQIAEQTEADKNIIEDQLEAINVAPALQGTETDFSAHFSQKRHQRGFTGVKGGSRWAVMPKKSELPNSAAQATKRQEAAQPQLPDKVAHALDALNTAQDAYTMAWQEINELRYQTFCDWHKYMSAFYSENSDLKPFRQDSQSFRDFMKKSDLNLLDEKIEKAGTLVDKKNNQWQAKGSDGSITLTIDLTKGTLSPGWDPKKSTLTLAVQVILRLQKLVKELMKTGVPDQFEVANRPTEHFWRPCEPNVLLNGDIAVSTPRHCEDGALSCEMQKMDVPGSRTFIKHVDSLKPQNSEDHSFIQTQCESPWHPVILEWSAEVKPISAGRTENKEIADTLDYDSDFLTKSFNLNENEPDLSPSDKLTVGDRNTYEGRCVMTPTAGTQLCVNLSNFLKKTTLYDCLDLNADMSLNTEFLERLITWYQQKHPGSNPPAVTSKKETDKKRVKTNWMKKQFPFIDQKGELFAIDEIQGWYGDKPVVKSGKTVRDLDAAQQANDPVYSAIRALKNLNGMDVLSQSLGGFNAALMTRKQVLQIPIEDPLEDPDSDGNFFTPEVAGKVSRYHPMAPLPGKVFSPIRSGYLTLSELRLIDTFGQQWKAGLSGARLVRASDFIHPNSKDKDLAYLKPRFAPPVRLNFRWLAAFSGQEGVDEVEMNALPATTPICGWLLPNNFNNSLMVYDNTGKALGSINSLAEWMPAPGSDDGIAAAEIANPHLRRLIRKLVVDVGTPEEDVQIRQDFMQSFLSTLDSALEAIEPANFAQHESLALLIGRPIAVTRARVDLQVMGQPMESETVSDQTTPEKKEIQLKKSEHWKVFADQDWDVFAHDWGKFYGCSYDDVKKGNCAFSNPSSLDTYTRTTHGFEDVDVPLRLGEHQLLSDGLVGFWKETDGGQLGPVFHSPQNLDNLEILKKVICQEDAHTPCIRAYHKGATDNLSLTLKQDPLTLTLLMDPRGVVHATSGIIPTQKLEIPSAYYTDALKRIAVTFRISPILTDAEKLHAAVPKEAGYVWSWVTKPDGSTWEETEDITDATEHAHFSKPLKISEGWLKLTPKKNS